MKAWKRVPGPKLCGLCGEYLQRNQKMLVHTVDGVAREFVRCESCAGEPAPDLPLLVDRSDEPGVTATGQRTFLPIGELAADWKQRQSGGDE